MRQSQNKARRDHRMRTVRGSPRPRRNAEIPRHETHQEDREMTGFFKMDRPEYLATLLLLAAQWPEPDTFRAELDAFARG